MSKERFNTSFECYRDHKGTTRVVFCYLERLDGDIAVAAARGISMCSWGDCPNEKLGRKIALGRAQKALHRGTNCGKVIRSERAHDILRDCGVPELFGYPKSEFVPVSPIQLEATCM